MTAFSFLFTKSCLVSKGLMSFVSSYVQKNIIFEYQILCSYLFSELECKENGSCILLILWRLKTIGWAQVLSFYIMRYNTYSKVHILSIQLSAFFICIHLTTAQIKLKTFSAPQQSPLKLLPFISFRDNNLWLLSS